MSSFLNAIYTSWSHICLLCLSIIHLPYYSHWCNYCTSVQETALRCNIKYPLVQGMVSFSCHSRFFFSLRVKIIRWNVPFCERVNNPRINVVILGASILSKLDNWKITRREADIKSICPFGFLHMSSTVNWLHLPYLHISVRLGG